jgi:hypothetical protein
MHRLPLDDGQRGAKREEPSRVCPEKVARIDETRVDCVLIALTNAACVPFV